MALTEKLGKKFEMPANIRIDLQTCFGCGLCQEVCPFDLPQENDIGRYDITETQLCVECGACARNCPVGAIIMEERKGCGCIWCDDATGKESDCCQ